MYLHWIPLPFSTYWLPFQEWQFTDLLNLSAFRLRHIARAIQISTSDGEVLQGWHAVPSQLSSSIAGSSLQAQDGECCTRGGPSEALREELFDKALADASHPALIYFHGQAGTRGVYNRVELLRALASQLQAHVIAIDYRGFGGSTGTPSQEGLLQDALAAWSWIRARRSTNIFLYGQSLGAAVALQLAVRLESLHNKTLGDGLDSPAKEEHAPVSSRSAGLPSGLILDAPFSSARAAALRHPLYRPLAAVPALRNRLIRAMVDRWENETAVEQVRCPMLIFGGGRDGVVGPEGAVQLMKAAAKARGNDQTATLLLVEDGLHTNMYASEEWLVSLSRFLAEPGSAQEEQWLRRDGGSSPLSLPTFS